MVVVDGRESVRVRVRVPGPALVRGGDVDLAGRAVRLGCRLCVRLTDKELLDRLSRVGLRRRSHRSVLAGVSERMRHPRPGSTARGSGCWPRLSGRIEGPIGADLSAGVIRDLVWLLQLRVRRLVSFFAGRSNRERKREIGSRGWRKLRRRRDQIHRTGALASRPPRATRIDCPHTIILSRCLFLVTCCLQEIQHIRPASRPRAYTVQQAIRP